MPYATDERLKSYLDTNQLHREQMCLAVLAADKRFSDVRPRHPRGGPDQARDIEAIFNGVQRAFGAVGFVNQATDSDFHRKSIAKKFIDDLTEALKQQPQPEVFVFFTNVNLTVGEKDELVTTEKQRELRMPKCSTESGYVFRWTTPMDLAFDINIWAFRCLKQSRPLFLLVGGMTFKEL